MNRFPCGVKHNFNTGDIFEKDRKLYGWNCTTCELKMNVETGKELTLKEIKTNRKVLCPLLTYE
ncbi:MAG: hypothetical protein ACFE8N_15285 [Promethearchaeota archaeon]